MKIHHNAGIHTYTKIKKKSHVSHEQRVSVDSNALIYLGYEVGAINSFVLIIIDTKYFSIIDFWCDSGRRIRQLFH